MTWREVDQACKRKEARTVIPIFQFCVLFFSIIIWSWLLLDEIQSLHDQKHTSPPSVKVFFIQQEHNDCLIIDIARPQFNWTACGSIDKMTNEFQWEPQAYSHQHHGALSSGFELPCYFCHCKNDIQLVVEASCGWKDPENLSRFLVVSRNGHNTT